MSYIKTIKAIGIGYLFLALLILVSVASFAAAIYAATYIAIGIGIVGLAWWLESGERNRQAAKDSLSDPVIAIAFAARMDDALDAQQFLTDWQHGDLDHWQDIYRANQS